MSWKKHFRIVKTSQQSAPAIEQDTNKFGGGTGTSSNFSSYLPIVYAGHPNRIQRYYQFDDMDRDSDINAALDTIADFSTLSEEHADEPFELKYNGEPNESEVKILKMMMAKWIKLNNFRAKLWYMFRDTLKNGDAFFLRDPETYEWLWLDHFMVEMVKIDDTHGKKPDEYLVRGLDYNRQTKFATKQADPNQYRTPYGTSNVGASRVSTVSASSAPAAFSLAGTAADPRQRHMLGPFSQDVSVVDAEHVVHLSLSIGNDINWPFGSSILEPIFKVYKQKELLEDSILIYRVQRAPERRIFYIDVGTMPPERAKRHIEMIKNDIHQRRIPNRTGGGANILDAAYNPLSINDDYFFAQCLQLDTKILLLDGRILSLAQLIVEYEEGKKNFVYSQNRETNELEAGEIKWAGITRKNATMVRVTLDNNEYVDVTPDHKFIMRDGTEIEAGKLQPQDSLMPLYLLKGRTGPRQKNAGYTRYISNTKGSKTKFVHSTICQKPLGRDWVVHHKDFNSENNNPDNLEVMSHKDHEALHKSIGTYSLNKQWNDPIAREKIIFGIKRLYENATPEFNEKLKIRNTKNGINTWKNPEIAKKVRTELRINCNKQLEKRRIKYSIELFNRVVELRNNGFDSVKKICSAIKTDDVFLNLYRNLNADIKRCETDDQLGSFFDYKNLDKVVQTAGYKTWGEFKQKHYKNHKVKSVELLPYTENTGDITIETISGSHIFALAAGIYVHNSSDGRGSKVETLPGGENLGEITDLMYFSRKIARGLRVPTSYLNLGEDESGGGGVTFNDGKLGAAMIQEFRFTKYCMRWQSLLAPVFDKEFKRFIIKNGFELDWSLFELQFRPPQSFTKYRQIELDAQRVQIYQGVSENRRLAERFKLKHYLGLTEDEMIENETMWSEENAAKIKAKTGSNPNDQSTGGLADVGVRPMDDGGMPMDGEMPPDGMPEEPPGGQADMAGAAAPAGAALPPTAGATQ